jgi:hypothetical protein
MSATEADPINFRDLSNPCTDFWRFRTSQIGFGVSLPIHTTRSVLSLELLLSLGIMSGVIC